MAELSRFHAIAPPDVVVPAELDRYFQERYGKPESVMPLRVFGTGFRFAFNVDYPRLSVDADDLIEFAMLAGPPDGMPIPGWEENDGYREFGERQLAHERTVAQLLAAEGSPSTRRIHDWVAATEVMDIRVPLNEALQRAGIPAAEAPDLDNLRDLTQRVL